MHFIGTYHAKTAHFCARFPQAARTLDGFGALRAGDVTAEGPLLAFVSGRLRNRAALVRELRLPSDASQSACALAAYRRWGQDFPTRLEGPVVAGVFDAAADQFVLSRDRMGECPLFYCACEQGLAFADHPDALLEAGLLRPVVDAAGVGELFALGPARTPGRTPYRDLMSMEPGWQLIARDRAVQLTRYYALPVRGHADGEEETQQCVRALIEQAVADILPLQPAAMLSGGIDSTALTALLCARQAEVKSFSVDYAQNERYFEASAFQPERDAPYITMAVEALGTDHLRVVLSQQALADALDEAVDARGFPGMADVDSSLLLFSREIAPYARCVVSGECGDEVFGGYPWFKKPDLLREDAFPWSGSLTLREAALRPALRAAVDVRGAVREALATARAEADALPGESDADARLRLMQQLCFRFFMANLQERAVCMGRACGLTVLTPFSDERLVEYVYNVPWELKFLGGQEKGLLRAAVADLLPEPLLRRRKSPYPKTCSPEYTALVVQRMQDLLRDADAPLWALADREAISGLAGSRLSPVETPWFGQLMAGPQLLAYLLQVNAWLDKRNIEICLEKA